jgi:hypothetical protein
MREVIPNPKCNNWQHGDCRGRDQEQEQEDKDDLTAEEIPYRQVRLAHLHLLLRQTMAHFLPAFFFLAFPSCRRLVKGMVGMQSDLHPMVCLLCSAWKSSDRLNPAAAKRSRAPRQKWGS